MWVQPHPFLTEHCKIHMLQTKLQFSWLETDVTVCMSSKISDVEKKKKMKKKNKKKRVEREVGQLHQNSPKPSKGCVFFFFFPTVKGIKILLFSNNCVMGLQQSMIHGMSWGMLFYKTRQNIQEGCFLREMHVKCK